MPNNERNILDICSVLLKHLIPDTDDISFDTYSEPVEVTKWHFLWFEIGSKIEMKSYVRITVSSGDIKVMLEGLPEQMFNEIDGCIALADTIRDKMRAAKYFKSKEMKNV